MDLSIIIVNFNTKELTQQTIESIQATVFSHSYEIIVADNSSDKKKIFKNTDKCSDIKVFRLANNGFGNACNLAAKKARGKSLLFLNSDTILHHGTVDKCLNYLNHRKTVGIVGAKVILKNGKLDHGCKRGFPTPLSSLFYFLKLDEKFPTIKFFGGYRKTYVKENSIAEVDAVSGAFLLIKSKLFFDLDGFDEDFFMYGEDIDLCYRVKENGFRVVYYGKASLVHLKGQSGLHTSSKKIISDFYKSMSIFYDKHYKAKYPLLVTFAVKSAILFKYLLTLHKGRKKPRNRGKC